MNVVEARKCIGVFDRPLACDAYRNIQVRENRSVVPVSQQVGTECAFHMQINEPLQLYYQYQNTPTTSPWFAHVQC
jgi:hypothetical protein